MSFASLEFAVFCVLAGLVLNVLRSTTARLLAVLVLNAVFVASFLTSAQQVIPLLGFVAAGYVAIRAAPYAGKAGLWLCLVIIVALFVWLKRYTIVAFLPNLITFPYLMLGISYILFRVVHLLIDVQQGLLKPPGPLRYLAYLFFFLGFVSGPIQRYEDFEKQLAEPSLPRSTDRIDTAFQRIVRGLFLVAVVTQITSYLCQHMEPRVLDALASRQFGAGLFVVYTGAVAIYLVHLYLNFTGYMEMVIGIGMLCGFSLPENFDRPYLSENFLDLWSRWHITLSNWFKYYVFNTTLKALAERYGTPARMGYLSAFAFFVTFGLMGIWHGSTGIFVCYGLMLGLGASLNKVYQVEMVKRLGRKPYRALCERSWYRHLSRAMTIAYFAIAVTALWLTPEAVVAFLSPKGVLLAVFAFAVVAAITFVLGYVVTAAAGLWRRRPAFLAASGMPGSGWVAPVYMGVKLFAVVVVIAMIDAGSAPEFVYKVF